MMEKEDKDLEVIFSGEERPLHPDTVHISLSDLSKNREARKNQTTEEKAEHKPTHSFEDGKWEPVKPKPNWMDKLKSCAMLTAPFSALTLLVFYWNEAGLMDSSIAVPSMIFCACLAGLGIGRVVSK